MAPPMIRWGNGEMDDQKNWQFLAQTNIHHFKKY